MESEIDTMALDRLRRLGGEELISNMVTLFISHAESAIRQAGNAVAEGDFEGIRRSAHALKSSAGNVGAQQLQDLADQMEQMAEKKAGGIQPLMTELEDAYLRAKDRLNREVQKGKGN